MKKVIILNEERLSEETLRSIAKDYGMSKKDDDVIKRFYFDTDEFRKRIVNAVVSSLRFPLEK